MTHSDILIDGMSLCDTSPCSYVLSKWKAIPLKGITAFI